MPPEWWPHERTWMAWPSGGYTLGGSPAEAEAARTAWAGLANTIVDHEPLTMVVAPGDEADAARHLSSAVELLSAPLDDAWMRDIGPTFVLDEAGTLGAVSWVFNGWGQQDWATWGKDARIADTVAAAAGATVTSSPMVNEGGGIHVDGEGTVLVTRTVQLDPGRNPGWSTADVEAELSRTLRTTTTVWLPYGLTRDEQRFGTRGHVDIVATFTAPGQVLVHDQRDPEHPDHERSAVLRALLAEATDAAGRTLTVTALPAPDTLRDDEGWVDYSYINHVLVAGAVIAGSFGDAGDQRAAEVLAEVYPGREVLLVPAGEVFARGGGLHCITQQQPVAAPFDPARPMAT